MAIFNPAALGISRSGGGKKKDIKAQGAFDPLSLNDDQEDVFAQVEQIRKSTAQAVLLKQQELELFMSGEGFNKYSRWANKFFGSPEAAKLKTASDVAGQIADIRRTSALTIQSLLQPGASRAARMERAAEEVREEKERSTLGDMALELPKNRQDSPRGRIKDIDVEAYKAGEIDYKSMFVPWGPEWSDDPEDVRKNQLMGQEAADDSFMPDGSINPNGFKIFSRMYENDPRTMPLSRLEFISDAFKARQAQNQHDQTLEKHKQDLSDLEADRKAAAEPDKREKLRLEIIAAKQRIEKNKASLDGSGNGVEYLETYKGQRFAQTESSKEGMYNQLWDSFDSDFMVNFQTLMGDVEKETRGGLAATARTPAASVSIFDRKASRADVKDHPTVAAEALMRSLRVYEGDYTTNSIIFRIEIQYKGFDGEVPVLNAKGFDTRQTEIGYIKGPYDYLSENPEFVKLKDRASARKIEIIQAMLDAKLAGR